MSGVTPPPWPCPAPTGSPPAIRQRPPCGKDPGRPAPSASPRLPTANRVIAWRPIPGSGDEAGRPARPTLHTAELVPAVRSWPGSPGLRRQRTSDDDPALHIADGARQYAIRAGREDSGRQPAGLRAGGGRRPDHRRRARAFPPGRGDQRAVRRRLDRQHQPHARALHRGRGLPDPAAADGGRGRALRRLVHPQTKGSRSR